MVHKIFAGTRRESPDKFHSILSTTRERFAFAFHHTHGTHIRDGMQREREIIVDMNRDVLREKGSSKGEEMSR
jgi:hypothetical protein